MFFFPIFWTAFIPFFIAIFSLVAEWLMRVLRQRRTHSFAPAVWGRQPHLPRH
jgi:hypothetical protein